MPVVDWLVLLGGAIEAGKLAVITGQSGIGKTATAKLYANECLSLGQTVLWVKADRVLKTGVEQTKS